MVFVYEFNSAEMLLQLQKLLRIVEQMVEGSKRTRGQNYYFYLILTL